MISLVRPNAWGRFPSILRKIFVFQLETTLCWLWLYSGTKGFSFSLSFFPDVFLGSKALRKMQRFNMFQPLLCSVIKPYVHRHEKIIHPHICNGTKWYIPTGWWRENHAPGNSEIVKWPELKVVRDLQRSGIKRSRIESHWQVIIFTNADSVNTCNACGVDAVSVFAAAWSARTNGLC